MGWNTAGVRLGMSRSASTRCIHRPFRPPNLSKALRKAVTIATRYSDRRQGLLGSCSLLYGAIERRPALIASPVGAVTVT